MKTQVSLKKRNLGFVFGLFFRDQFQPRHIGSSHADAGKSPEDHGACIVMGEDGEAEIGGAGPDNGEEKDVSCVDPVGHGAEDDA